MVSLASISDALNVWKYENSRLELTSSFTSSSGTCNCLAWNHTNQVVATGGENQQIHLIQANNGNVLSSLQVAPEGSANAVTRAIAFSSNSRFLSATLSNTIQVWDLKRRQIKAVLGEHRDTVSALCFLPNGEIVSGDNSGVVRIWEAKSYAAQGELFASSGTLSAAQVTSLSVPPSGGNALAVGYSEGTLRVWDIASHTLLRTQLCHDGSLTSLAYSPRNPRLVTTAGADGRVTLIDTGSKNTTGPSAMIDLQGVAATAVSFHEDAIHTAVGLADGRILIYDWRSLRKPVVNTAPREMYPILSLAFQVPKTTASGGNSVAGSAASSRPSRAAASTGAPAAAAAPSTTAPTSAPTATSTATVPASAAMHTPPSQASAGVDVNSSASSVPEPTKQQAAVTDLPQPPRRTSSSLPPHPHSQALQSSPLRSSMRGASEALAEVQASADSLPSAASPDKVRAALRSADQLASPQLRNGSTGPAEATTPVVDKARSASERYSSISAQPGAGSSSGNGSAQKLVSSNRRSDGVLPPEWRQQGVEASFTACDIDNSMQYSSSGRDTRETHPPSRRGTLSSQQSTAAEARGRERGGEGRDRDREASRLEESLLSVRQAVAPVTSKELEDSLALLKYDIHREIQDVIREQIRQFAIAKDETAELLKEMSAQVAELMAANKELRAENERLRHIY